MSKQRYRASFQALLRVAAPLTFQPHRIAHLLDAKGRHELELPTGFPFAVSLFHFREGAITQRLTWHQRLELLVPLDGPLRERMGDLVVDLQPGDILVVDHLKPHQVVDAPGLNTRAVVISFLQEWVFAPGSPPTDYAFLLPFFKKVEGRPHVLRAQASLADEAHDAVGRLLGCYFAPRKLHHEAGCKTWLLVLLHALIHEFRDSVPARAELLRRQEHAARLKPVFDHVRTRYADRFTVKAAAGLCGMSQAVFCRVFKKTSGLTLNNYLNYVRMAHAIELLEESGASVAEIASKLGFCDQSYFDRRFRQTFGRTPSQHRTLVVGLK